MEEVGDHQQPIRRVQHRVAVGRHRGELEDGVDRHQLNAGPLVELARGNLRQNTVDRGSTARVPIVDGVLQQVAAPVEETEVHSPGVDAHRLNPPRVTSPYSQALQHAVEQV